MLRLVDFGSIFHNITNKEDASKSLKEFNEKVAAYLNNGWHLHGTTQISAPSVGVIYMYQAFIRYR